MNLNEIKGVGPKTEELLNRLNIFSVEDLVTFFPYKYKHINFNKQLNNHENIYIKATIISEVKGNYIRRNFNILRFKVIFDAQEINVVIYNRMFLKNNLKLNQQIVLYGKYDQLKNTFLASDIIFDIEDNKIIPIYRQTKGINSGVINKIIFNVIDKIDHVDYVPDIFNEKYKFISKKEAVNKIHFPKTLIDIKQAKVKLIYEEFFIFMLKLKYLKNQGKVVKGIERKLNSEDIKGFDKYLKFSLTKDQEKAFNDVLNDLISSRRMNRLIMGDVGSGKTVVAIYAIYLNYLSKHQSAFMAPTEILAAQHYQNIKEMLPFLNIKLLTSKTKKSDKDKIKKDLLNNKIDLIIGTHSILNEEVVFDNLGLIITDEQHRFGVKQRKKLEDKGNNPDILYLSATPIPRTYALVLYNDMELSIIKTKPAGRKEVLTKVISEKNIKEVLFKIKEELDKNNQIFVVSPLIENEESDLASVYELKQKYEKAFKKTATIDIIYGSMTKDEKEEKMNLFLENKINILISTTVIEVGIDIKNATMMVIYNAERFGLATLHQLRGRVGRSNKDSYCYLISESDNKRLNVMVESNDGFYITEQDLLNRKEGDLFGEKQSGEATFKLANINNDMKILLLVANDIKEQTFIDEEKYKSILEELN